MLQTYVCQRHTYQQETLRMQQRTWSASSGSVWWRMDTQTQQAKQHDGDDCFSLGVCVSLPVVFAPRPNSAMKPILGANMLKPGLVCLSIRINIFITRHVLCMCASVHSERVLGQKPLPMRIILCAYYLAHSHIYIYINLYGNMCAS